MRTGRAGFCFDGRASLRTRGVWIGQQFADEDRLIGGIKFQVGVEVGATAVVDGEISGNQAIEERFDVAPVDGVVEVKISLAEGVAAALVGPAVLIAVGEETFGDVAGVGDRVGIAVLRTGDARECCQQAEGEQASACKLNWDAD